MSVTYEKCKNCEYFIDGGSERMCNLWHEPCIKERYMNAIDDMMKNMFIIEDMKEGVDNG